MSNQDIFTLMKMQYNVFTNTERKVADYILENAKEVVYMSINDLADACGVGESSVFRFCKTLKLKGYQEFKIMLAHFTSLEDGPQQISDKIEMEDSINELAAKILTTNIQALTETHQLIDEENIAIAIDKMILANRIQFFGVGASLTTAMEGKNKFMRIVNKIDCSMDSHLQIMSASLMTSNDVAILISYSGSTKDMIEIAKVLKERNVFIILITRFAKSPLTAFANCKLLCGANEGPLQGGSLSAKISQLYLLDVLYSEYYKRTYNESTENKERTAKSVIEKMV